MARTGSCFSSGDTPRAIPWGVLLALALALGACRSREGERCVCADDCRGDLVCVASGRVLDEGECNPAVGANADPGVCVLIEGNDDGAADTGPPEVRFDLGSKRDFDPGPPPDRDTATDGTTAGTSDTTSTDGTTGTDTASSSSDGAGTSSGTTSTSSGGSSGGSTTAGT